MDKSSAPGFSSSLSVFSPSHLTGALHAGVLCRNRWRHHGQDALWRLAVTVQTGSTGRPGNAGCTGNTAGSPQTFTTVFTVSWSARFTWKNQGFIRTLSFYSWVKYSWDYKRFICNNSKLILRNWFSSFCIWASIINDQYSLDYRLLPYKTIFISNTTKFTTKQLHILKLYIFKNEFSRFFFVVVWWMMWIYFAETEDTF